MRKNQAMIAGGLFGFFMSIMIILLQNNDWSVYLFAPAYYISKPLTEFVNLEFRTFIYYILFFGSVGYIFPSHLLKPWKMLFLLALLILHILLIYLGSRLISTDIRSLLNNFPPINWENILEKNR